MERIGIITASDDELKPFLDRLGTGCTVRGSMLDFHKAVWNGIELVLCYSGVCKVNAAIAAMMMTGSFRVDALINAGTAGGMDPSVRIMDTVISERLVYHDVADDILTEFHPWLEDGFFHADPELLDLAGRYSRLSDFPVRFGTIATGEAFISGEARIRISGKWAPLAVDMESAAVAHVAYVNAIPFLSVRTITDDAVNEGLENFDRNCLEASSRSADIVLGMLQLLTEEKPSCIS